MKNILMGLSALAAILTFTAIIIALPSVLNAGSRETVRAHAVREPIVIHFPIEDELEPEPEEEEEDPGPDLTGLAMNPLTGHYIDEDLAWRRPLAVVINNINQALPQSGIAQADVIYEVLAEGGVTRLVAIYKEMDAEKIGPVRSTRHYFLDFALNHDAVLVHHGGSPQGYAAISNMGAANLDGMHIVRAFFRDPARAAIPRMIEHSSFEIGRAHV